jgi:hypothetical protein
MKDSNRKETASAKISAENQNPVENATEGIRVVKL